MNSRCAYRTSSAAQLFTDAVDLTDNEFDQWINTDGDRGSPEYRRSAQPELEHSTMSSILPTLQ
jgi:hypothetical protein